MEINYKLIINFEAFFSYLAISDKSPYIFSNPYNCMGAEKIMNLLMRQFALPRICKMAVKLQQRNILKGKKQKINYK